MAVDVAETEQSDRSSIALQVPNELKELVDAKAEAAKLSTAAYVRGLVAADCSYTMPVDFGTRSKYGSDEERKAAAKAKAQKRNALLNMLLKNYREGKIDLNDLLADDDED
jgi:hypothetical protein